MIYKKKNWSIVDFYERVTPKTRWKVVINRDQAKIKAYFWADLQDFLREEIRDAVFLLVIFF